MGLEPFVGEICILGFTFAPSGYALCNGQIMSIAQNTALFSLLGTTYGGNGTTTFALPDLRGRAPIHVGQGPGLADYAQGQVAGVESATLTSAQLPAHTHSFANNGSALSVITIKATSQIPAAGSQLARTVDGSGVGAQPLIYVPAGTAGATVALGGLNIAGTIGSTGQNQPVSIMQPYLVLNFSIALQGIFPSRN